MTRTQYLALQLSVSMAFGFLAALVTSHTVNAQSNTSDKVTVIVNVAKVFEEDATFQAQLEKLKTQAKSINESDGDDEREILQLETDAYVDCYLRMTSVIERLSDTYNINLVLRADTTPIERKDAGTYDRAAVMARINSSVVFHDKLDLTRLVIKNMKQDSETAPVSSGPKRTPKFCDQCGQKLVKGESDCGCLADEAAHSHANQN